LEGEREEGTRILSLVCDISVYSVLVFCYHKGYNIPLKRFQGCFSVVEEGGRGQIPVAIICSKDFQFLAAGCLF
jgi:hypothetical protein